MIWAAPVRRGMTDAGPTVDTAGLQAYLSAALDEQLVDATVLHDGLNLSIAVSTVDEPEAYVVRRPSKRRHRDLFSELRQEYRLLERLAETSIETPAPVHYCEDASIIGDEFYVMTHLDGTEIPWDSRLPERFRTRPARRHLGEGLIDTLAEIHTLDPGRFEDVCTRRSATDQLDSALDRLDAATAVTGHGVRRLRAVAVRLREPAPEGQRLALTHGDFQPYNLFVVGDEVPEITGVYDWEAATLGDPFAELGYLLLTWRDESDPPLPIDDIEVDHPTSDALDLVRERNESGFFPWTTAPGSPTRRELVDRYESRTGYRLEHDRYYRAHAAVTFATVWADLYRHQVENDQVEPGEGSGWEPHVEYVALMAESILDGDVPL